MTLKPFPDYKDSGLHWVGRIPAHWTVWRTKNLLKEIDDRTRTGEEPLLSMRQNGVLVLFNSVSDKRIDSGFLIGYKRTLPNDIVLNRMQAGNGMFARCKQLGLVSPDYAVLRPIHDLNSEYFALLFKSPAMRTKFRMESKGLGTGTAGFLRLYTDRFASISVPVPTKQEQNKIVDFVNQINNRISRLVLTKKRQITLLTEQKQAMVRKAVTRGLNPLTYCQPSKVSWIGDVPRHWELRKLKHLARFQNGIAFKPSDWEHIGIPIIRIQNLNGADEFNYTIRHDLPPHLLIRPGELLFAWSGNRGTSFGSFLWDRPFSGYLNQHIFKVSNHNLNTRFFYYLLRAVTTHVEEQTHGIIGLVHITKPELGSITVPVPPATEQEQIAKYLDTECEQVNRAISVTRREIELIREYRTRLIADVVTGKLDVRGVEVPESEDVEAVESLEAEEASDMEGEGEETIAAGESEDAAN